MNLDFATTSLLANMAIAEAPTLDSLTPEEARLAYTEIYKGLPGAPKVFHLRMSRYQLMAQPSAVAFCGRPAMPSLSSYTIMAVAG